MKIIDLNDKEREAKSLKIITHIRTSDCAKMFHENVEGELKESGTMHETTVEEKYVEANIIGKSKREWIEWYQLALFEEKNPNIKIE